MSLENNDNTNKHGLFRQKKEPIKPEWEEDKEAEKESEKEKEIELLLKQIKEIEDILFPDNTNVVTLPQGMDENMVIEKLENKRQELIEKYKKLTGGNIF